MGLEGWSIVVMALLIGATQATEYKVGDSFGWNVPTNQSFYSDWAASISNYQTFSVGDKLIFNWTGTHNVANVSKEDYENCSAAASPWGSSANDTSYVVNITESGPHFYICTVGNHCASGQKVIINVAYQSTPDSSAPTVFRFGLLSAFVCTLAVYFFTRG